MPSCHQSACGGLSFLDCHASLAMTSSTKLTRHGETHGDVAVDCRASLAMTEEGLLLLAHAMTTHRLNLILDCFASLAMTTGSITMRHGEERSDVAILN
jgi:hypothetical protein